MPNILLATDLDRTVLPNGDAPESPEALPRLSKLAARPEVTLAYVSGRDRDLIQQAISQYNIPSPDYAIGDVGTTIYKVGQADTWSPLTAWEQAIAPDWQGKSWNDMKALFDDTPELRLQQDRPEQQNTFKLSYFTDADVDKDALLERLQTKVDQENLQTSLIFSIDEQKKVGLLDVLPKSATKLHAVEFLIEHLGLDRNHTVFCGDSGNDLPALTSGLPAVMVKNTHPDVVQEATDTMQSKGQSNRLYLATGDFLGMNGNYSAGVLEGVAHYFPATADWLKEA